MKPHTTLDDFYIFVDLARLHYWRADYESDPHMYWGVWFFGTGPFMSPMNFFAHRTRKKMGQLLNQV